MQQEQGGLLLSFSQEAVMIQISAGFVDLRLV